MHELSIQIFTVFLS